MTRWSTTLALALAAGALTAWWVLVERPRMGAELFPGRIFFSLMREDIERFEILRPGARIVIARGLPGQWRIEAPLSYDAAVGPVDVLVGAVVFLESKLDVDEGAEGAFPAAGPAVTLRFRARGEEHVIEIGNRHMSKNLAYYRCAGRVFLAEEVLKVQCERPFDDWRDRTVVPLRPDEVGGVAIRGGGRNVVLERAPQGFWLMRSPLSARADGAFIQRLLDSLNCLSALQFLGDDGKASPADYGLDAPRWEVALTPLAGAERIVLAVGKAREGAVPAEVYVKREDKPQIFRVEDGISGMLAIDSDDLREQRVLPFAGAGGWVRSVAVRGPATEYSLTRSGPEGDWLLVNSRSGRQWKTPRQRGEELVDSIGQLRVGQFLPERPMGAERLRVSVTVDGLPDPMELIFGDESGEGRCLARRKGVEGEPDETIEISSSLAGRLPDDIWWQPLVRAEISEAALLAFTLRTSEGSWLLLRTVAWSADGFPGTAIDQGLVEEAVKLICAPTAVYFEPSPRPLEEMKLTRGLARARVGISQQLGEFPYYELLVGARVDPPRELSYAKLDKDDRVIILDPAPLLALGKHLGEVCKP
ncbi:MAG TPA: DUF4340 domain-containing protein [Planctomycetota bacterium]|nr:DUF4340 domain-containing protein [Planctomycetota bacterium]OQC20356.1 MAG: hypothetical protein BWX69_01853 [Planctomycetes bacterium ADurb.Bin069]HNR98659.1 DUF4340 domain-containing protein [Planctomycetota bacterium]HNU25039.1 DUF4340 domain-containing protein [Planctomycetota bacterium]HOE28477.1 DUF4340 domain-containing protein [Planctomycetota bacterium]